VNALKGRGGPLSSGSEEGREGIVHRLDKETSGLLLVAKSDRAHRVLGAELQARRITRRYVAMVWGHLSEDRLTVEQPIARDPRDRKRMAIVSTGRPARTEFTRLARFESVDLLRAHLFTGRTHQIRVHLASLGHQLVGDPAYGRKGGVAFGRQALHAARLALVHPASGRHVRWDSTLPADFESLLAALRARRRR
jgi:23S rRNA pseudouridine1911/1915/1917 synthase